MDDRAWKDYTDGLCGFETGAAWNAEGLKHRKMSMGASSSPTGVAIKPPSHTRRDEQPIEDKLAGLLAFISFTALLYLAHESGWLLSERWWLVVACAVAVAVFVQAALAGPLRFLMRLCVLTVRFALALFGVLLLTTVLAAFLGLELSPLLRALGV